MKQMAYKLMHRFGVIAGAVLLTLAFFLVLPLMQQITKPPDSGLMVAEISVAELPPPPPPVEEEPEQEPEPEDTPPELDSEQPLLDLSQLELALNPGFGDGALTGDFAVKLNAVSAQKDDVDALFSLNDLDQRPRVIHQPSPNLTAQIRRKAPGTVYVIFIVDENGRVVQPSVQRSSDRIFESAALAAVKQWRFEPGKRNGQPVRFRMRVPITFPKGL
jgi:protein TonB